MSQPPLTVGSFFSGCGGLDYGLKNSGFSLAWANDIEVNFAASYSRLCSKVCNVGDFWKIANEMPEVDVIVGGPPCQSFSLVGKRLRDDPRGQLIGGYLELLLERRPRGFLIENVAGLTASKVNGMPLSEHIANELRGVGYDVILQKVDASKYFVPQKRKRVIIAGVMNPAAEVRLASPSEFRDHLFQRTGLSFALRDVTVAEALSDLGNPSNLRETMQYESPPVSEFQKILRIGSDEKVDLHYMPTMSQLDREFVKHIPPGGNYLNIPDSISTTRIRKFKASGGRTTTYGRLHPDRAAYTINTYFNRPNVGANYHYFYERLITVREAMRLQSFPDFFVPKFKSMRELHVQIGNAVPPLLGEALGLSLWRAMQGN